MRMPLCKSPDHPGDDRDTMILLEEKQSGGQTTHYVFGCLKCKEVNKVLSVQVRVAPEYKAFINSDPKLAAYKRARLVERDPTSGRIKYFR
jgi:hypothetical protein